MLGDELLTTGEAARLLGSSRQHVVDLCDRGLLACVRVGSHRRVPLAELRRLLQPESALSREQERSLWLHQALLGRLVADPDGVLSAARANLRRLRVQHPRRGNTAHWLDEWERVLDGGVDAVAAVLSSASPLALELRQNSPFAGVISQRTRSKVLASFADHWRTAHAPPPTVATG